MEVLNGGSALSLTNGSEEKSLQGQGFKAWSSIAWKPGCQLFLFYTSFMNVSICGEGYIHSMTTLKDIRPVMTLFYDYNMLFIEMIYDRNLSYFLF